MAIIIRTIVTYFMLILLMRLMGKRQLGELEVSELTVTFMLSDLASAPLLDLRMDLFDSFTPISVIVGLEILLAYVTLKSPLLKNALYGSPSVIIYISPFSVAVMRKTSLSVSPLPERRFVSHLRSRQSSFRFFDMTLRSIITGREKSPSSFAKNDSLPSLSRTQYQTSEKSPKLF